MLNTMYTFLFLASAILLIFLVWYFKDMISVNYVMLFASAVVINFGYMQLSDAPDIRAALYANQTVYLGASFSPFFHLMCFSDLCKTKVRKKYQIMMIVYGAVIFGLVSSIGSSNIYYKSVELIQKNGVSFLVKEHGTLHVLYPIYLGFVLGLGFALIMYAVLKKRDVSYITAITLFMITSCIILTYTMEKWLKLEVEILPIAYVVSEVAILLLLRRISLYDVTAISVNSMIESHNYGFILFDSKGRYLGADVAAKLWFPVLKTLPLDRRVRMIERDAMLEQIEKWLGDEEEQDVAFIEHGDLILEVKHTILKERRTKSIHCVYLRDDTKQQKYTKLVEQYKEQLEHDVEQKTAKLRRIQNDIIISMASIVENRDNNTGGHIARTSDVVNIFVKHLREQNCFPGMTPEIAHCIIKAAPLHDFGKIAIPDVILNKPGKFTDEEYEIMKQHSAKGAAIVERILQHSEDTEFMKIAVRVAHYHHEKWDGRGYPDGLKGEEIPFEARIMALADVFDALVSKRVYKDSYSYDKAFTIIAESAGTHFEPRLCKEFLECRDQLIALYDSYPD